MEKLYLQIAERLDRQVDGLLFIDEDTGQLIEEGDGYPVVFPCILIDLSTVDWTVAHSRNLRGTVTMTVKHAFDCTEDTHYAARRYQRFAGLEERIRQHRQAVAALHGWSPGGTTALQRTQSRQYTLFGRVKVYEETFSLRLTEDLDADPDAEA